MLAEILFRSFWLSFNLLQKKYLNELPLQDRLFYMLRIGYILSHWRFLPDLPAFYKPLHMLRSLCICSYLPGNGIRRQD